MITILEKLQKKHLLTKAEIELCNIVQDEIKQIKARLDKVENKMEAR
jgi:hypothetical protein